jgi:hypothetical protein
MNGTRIPPSQVWDLKGADALRAAEDGVGRLRIDIKEVVLAAEKSEELIETPLQRMKLRRVAEVRLADPTRHVAGGFQAVADRFLGRREPDVRRGEMGGAGIEFVAEPLLVPAGHQARASQAAVRTAHIATREPHAVLRDAVNLRRGHLRRVPLAAQLPVSEIIGDDEEDVGSALGRAGRQTHQCRQDRQRECA